MDWIRAHPYVVGLGAAGLLLILGSALIASRVAVPEPSDLRVWTGGGQPLINPLALAPNQEFEPGLYFDSATNTPRITILQTNASAEANGFDFQEFLAGLIEPRGTAASTTADTKTFSFIPSGLVSTTTPSGARTDSQQALLNYGNDAGSYIQSHEERYRNAAIILRDQAEDRSNAEKAAAVKNIGKALTLLGKNLENMEEIPTAIASAHMQLAQSYVEIGENLQKVPGATGDAAFLAAIEAYNASVETFTKRYVAVALLLSAHRVKFAPYESGSVFTFTNASF